MKSEMFRNSLKKNPFIDKKLPVERRGIASRPAELRPMASVIYLGLKPIEAKSKRTAGLHLLVPGWLRLLAGEPDPWLR